jgi:hypothetical protein
MSKRKEPASTPLMEALDDILDNEEEDEIMDDRPSAYVALDRRMFT